MSIVRQFGSAISRLANLLLGAVRHFLQSTRKFLSSVRAWVLVILLLIAILVVYYVMADLYTPLTTDAYVQAYVIQVAPRVEGQVVHLYVQENQPVKKGDLLFEIDPRPFEYQVALLEAKRIERACCTRRLDRR